MDWVIENLFLVVFVYSILGLAYITLQAWFYEQWILKVSGIKLVISYIFWVFSAACFLLLLWVRFVVGFKKGWNNDKKTNRT